MPTLIRTLLATSLLLLVACSAERDATEATPDAPAGPSAFRQFLDANYAIDMAQKPRTASRRGLRDNNREWDPYSEAFYDTQRQQWEERLATLSRFDPASLDDGEAISLQLYEQELKRNIASDEFRHQKYVIHHYRGVHTRVPTFLANMHPVNSVQDMEDYIARLNAVETLFSQVIEQLAIRTDKGVFLPRWSYAKLTDTIANTLTGAPFDDSGSSSFWSDIQRKLDGLEIEPEERQRLQEAARIALLEVVRPAYQRLSAAVSAQAELAPEGDGVWKHPDGEAYYAERLAYFTTTDLSAEQVHSIGLENVARIHAEMREIMEKVGFEGELPEFMTFMRESPDFYYPNSDEGRARYMIEATEMIDTMRERLPEYFGLLPKADVVVKRVEPFRERAAGKAFYQSPPEDGSRPGIYYANLYDMKSMPTYQMEALAYHEGIPGHHMQRAISIEKQDIPAFQKYASFTAYTEGWGLYTEELPKEMGFYSDPYSDFGRLAMELWRAARLVVDTGLHHKRWSREEAVEYLVANTPNARYDAEKAIERYSVMPGQATAYMIGKLKIMELRENARAALGERFDIRGFHDEVLKDGPVPLYVLEEKIDRWVASQQG